MKRILFPLLPSLVLLLLSLVILVDARAQAPVDEGAAWALHGGESSIAAGGLRLVEDRADCVVTGIAPDSAANDIATSVVVTGSGFAIGEEAPRVLLGGIRLTNVKVVDGETLTATVPWGMDLGSYALTVVNPDDGTGSLGDAFTVTQGIGSWNGGDLYGGDVHQILMKPGDPNTLFATAYGVGLFRTRDAGEHWAFISAATAIANGTIAIDPLHPGWIYGSLCDGLLLSKDEGETWSTVMGNVWPDGRALDFKNVHVSPHTPQALFVSSCHAPHEVTHGGEALGLIRSTNGGASWQIVADMEGVPVQDVAFHPTDPATLVLGTQDGRVFQSLDGGVHWASVAKPPISSIGYRGVISYNPYRPDEVWIVSPLPAGVFKSTAPDFAWQDVAPVEGAGALDIKFTGADSVFITQYRSTDGGATWQRLGPLTFQGELAVHPGSPQTVYIGDQYYGVQKTTDGGGTWLVKNQGLAGMRCLAVVPSQSDPLLVYATFGWGGIHRSDDGAQSWTYLPIPGAQNVRVIEEDPFDSRRLYVAADSGFYVSDNGGQSWAARGWNLPAGSPAGMPSAMQADPRNAGRLLACLNTGVYGVGTGRLYRSVDRGVSWQSVALPQTVAQISKIVFDPATAGTVYLSTGGTGLYRSTDSGASWTRIDDRAQPAMASAETIAVATRPQHVVLVGTGSQYPYRSLDGGDTWTRTGESAGGISDYVFADGDAARLYAGTTGGLYSLGDLGDSWQRAAGTMGTLNIMALGCSTAGSQSILYAATCGGEVAMADRFDTVSLAAGTVARSTSGGLVQAGVYRYVVTKPRVTLKLRGLKKGVARRRKPVTIAAVVKPRQAADKIKISVQRKKARKWVTVKTVKRKVRANGACNWKYRPTKKGRYRVRVTIPRTAARLAAQSNWRAFRVK